MIRARAVRSALLGREESEGENEELARRLFTTGGERLGLSLRRFHGSELFTSRLYRPRVGQLRTTSKLLVDGFDSPGYDHCTSFTTTCTGQKIG